MPATLSFDLHTLTAYLDRAADGILRAEHGVSYRRFRTLLSVHMLSADAPHAVTQRAVAEELGISEPSVSRMVGVLSSAGLLAVDQARAGGNRRHVRLTSEGTDLVDRCRRLLEDRFEDLVARSGVPYADYARHTRRLLETLSEAERS